MLLPSWFGLEGAGAFRALMNLAMPVLHSIGSLSGILLPVLSKPQRERNSWHGQNDEIVPCFVPFRFDALRDVFWGLRSELFRLLYGGKYQEYTFLPALLVGLLPFGSSLVTVLGSSLRALEQPEWIFWSYVGSAVVTLLVGLPLATAGGVSGGLLGILFSYLVAAALMLWFYRKSPRGQPAPGTAEALPSKASIEPTEQAA